MCKLNKLNREDKNIKTSAGYNILRQQKQHKQNKTTQQHLSNVCLRE